MAEQTTTPAPRATLGDVAKFFGLPLPIFRKEWQEFTPADKAQIQAGIGDGTYNY